MLSSVRGKQVMLAAAGLAASSIPSAALEASDVLRFSKEPVALMPQMSASGTFNDNIFFDEKGTEASDFVTVLSPGLKIQLGRLDGNYFFLNYRHNQYFYVDNDNLNTGEDVVALASSLNWNRLSISGSDNFSWLSSPLGGDEGTDVFGNPIRNNVNRLQISDNYKATVRLTEKTSTYGEIAYNSTDYEEGVTLFDNNTWVGTGGFDFHAFERKTFFGEVYYGQTASSQNTPYFKNPHMAFVGGFLGARGSFTEKLVGLAKVGYEAREFSDDSPAPSSPVANVSLTYNLSPKTAFVLTYARLNDVSVQRQKNAYSADRAALRVSQRFGSTGKWLASVGGGYSNYRYEPTPTLSDRESDKLTADLSLNYQVQEWLSAGVSYGFQKYVTTDSTRGSFDYLANQITFRVAVGY